MRDVKLTLVGGCINSGFSIVSLDGLYHRLLVREVQKTHGVCLRTSLGRQFQMNPPRIAKDAIDKLKKRPCDGLVFQIRPEWLYCVHTPIWVSRDQTETGKERKSIYWNPYLWGGELPWNNPPASMGSRRSPELTLRLSRLVGLTARAMRATEQMIDEIAQSCSAVGTDFILMGPVLGPQFPKVFVDHVHSVVLPQLVTHSTRYIDVSDVEWGRDCFGDDSFHLNDKGHRQIADLAQTVIGPWAAIRGLR